MMILGGGDEMCNVDGCWQFKTGTSASASNYSSGKQPSYNSQVHDTSCKNHKPVYSAYLGASVCNSCGETYAATLPPAGNSAFGQFAAIPQGQKAKYTPKPKASATMTFDDYHEFSSFDPAGYQEETQSATSAGQTTEDDKYVYT
ncbi:uncharacterized protein L201_008105 [Kwoniella dendrophila CBS 6074]|uniref:Uncharacterized protein n=1 Tax=Kwoniella dendrophila CBS 6074 TaxID=1295534 RepID=A0AAX4K7U8_9TREE